MAAAKSHVSETTRNPSRMPTWRFPCEIRSTNHAHEKPNSVARRNGAGDSR